MRKVDKSPKPPVLQEKGNIWTEEYLDAIKSGSKKPTRWRDKRIRSALNDETAERCVYCDSDMLSVCFGDVEHIKPRSIYPAGVVEWSNLTLACQRCNNAKSDYHSDVEPILNPYVDDPLEHLIFAGDLIYHKFGSIIGYTTVTQLKLSRKELVAARKRRLDLIATQLRNIEVAPNQEIASTLREMLLEDYKAGEFRNSVRSLLSIQGGFTAADLGDAPTAGDG